MNEKVKEYQEALKAMETLYGFDNTMSLATSVNDIPSVRVINAYYEDGALYVTSYGLSNKMQQIKKNPQVSLCKGLFQCWGTGENIGNPKDKTNLVLREKLRKVFFKFYDRHVCEDDPNTCILKIRLTKAVVFAEPYKYVVDFINHAAERYDFHNDIEE